MNIFQRLARRFEGTNDRLGSPAGSPESIQRRIHHFAAMTGGKGFRQYAQDPRKDSQGMTRGDRKRARRAAANLKIKGQQEAERAAKELARQAFAGIGS